MSYLTDIDWPTVAVISLIYLVAAFIIQPYAFKWRAASGMYRQAIEDQIPLLKDLIEETVKAQFDQFLVNAQEEAEAMQAHQMEALAAAEKSAHMSELGVKGQTAKQIGDAKVEIVRNLLGPMTTWAFEMIPTLEEVSRRDPEAAMLLVQTTASLLKVDLSDPQAMIERAKGVLGANGKPSAAPNATGSTGVSNPYG